jgi:hypothetical protein
MSVSTEMTVRECDACGDAFQVPAKFSEYYGHLCETCSEGHEAALDAMRCGEEWSGGFAENH